MDNLARTSVIMRIFLALTLVWMVILTPAAANPSSAGDAVLVLVTPGAYLDTDGDGLSDEVETALTTDPLNFDSDGDGLPDGWEVWNGLDPNNPDDAYADANGDGLTNLEKFDLGLDPYLCDSDSDGFWDIIEFDRGTDGASASSYPKSNVPCDVDQNGVVDAVDLQYVINGTLGVPTPVPTNVNAVGDVDAMDVQAVVFRVLGMNS
ncbi:MAG: hypothetical protein U9Q79_11285 [Candidatus Hydrogenedentes bacterium]|nr:hypothetical protein [Candidatus Hydrogenedentota bacterium]